MKLSEWIKWFEEAKETRGDIEVDNITACIAQIKVKDVIKNDKEFWAQLHVSSPDGVTIIMLKEDDMLEMRLMLNFPFDNVRPTSIIVDKNEFAKYLKEARDLITKQQALIEKLNPTYPFKQLWKRISGK